MEIVDTGSVDLNDRCVRLVDGVVVSSAALITRYH